MLIYANNFDLTGSDSFQLVFEAILNWLCSKTKKNFCKTDFWGKDFSAGDYQISTYVADKREPHIYSILLQEKDRSVSGRKWFTEISVRKNSEDSTFFSILLRTEEVSTQVQQIPETTCPQLINNLAKMVEFSGGSTQFSAENVGSKIKNLQNSDEDCKVFLYEIEKEDRSYPLVLVSSSESGTPCNPEWLQKQLFGLAQVIYISETVARQRMERILTANYSAWDGAVNIISPYMQDKGFCYTNLLRSQELVEIQEKQKLTRHILSLITHRTNLIKKRKHFSPLDVRAKRQKDHLLDLREQSLEGKDDKERVNYYQELCEEAFKESNEKQDELEKLSEEIKIIEDEKIIASDNIIKLNNDLNNRNYTIKNLQNQLDKVSYQPKGTSFNKQNIVFYLSKERSLTPLSCLETIRDFLPDKIVILDTALESAKNSDSFENSHQLIKYLWKLGDEFLPAFLQGGDNKAKDVFTTGVYSARESEQTMNNSEYKHHRTFLYNGQKITMWRHLKIGVSNNKRQTLRTHFHVDTDAGKVVIGYCGEHLPIISVS